MWETTSKIRLFTWPVPTAISSKLSRGFSFHGQVFKLRMKNPFLFSKANKSIDVFVF